MPKSLNESGRFLMNHKVILFCLLLPFLSAGESHAAGEDVLPEAVRVLMKKHRIQAGKIGIVVQRLDTHEGWWHTALIRH